MARVKMNAKHEYEYIANFKVMQNAFKAKRIDKVRAAHIRSLNYFDSVQTAHTRREACEVQDAVCIFPLYLNTHEVTDRRSLTTLPSCT